MAACNTETILARALRGHYARAGDEAYALIREALQASGDITPQTAPCTSASTRYPHPAVPAPSPPSASSSAPPKPRYPGTSLTLHYEVKDHPRHCINDLLCQEP